MNPLPPNADELVSAYLDGEAAPDEVATVESSPELMARVASLRVISGQLGAPVTPPPAQKEAHLAAALGAFDALFAGETSAATEPLLAAVPDPPSAEETPVVTATTNRPKESPTVRSLDAARQRRKPRRFNTGVIAASAVAMLLLAVVAALSFGGGTADNVATEAGLAEASDSTDTSSDDAASIASDAEIEEAMEDEAAGGLSDLQTERAAPQPTISAFQAPSAAIEADGDEASGAMAEEPMDDEEEAMEEEAMDDEDAMADDAGALDSANVAELMLGEFPTVDALLLDLESFSEAELLDRVAAAGQGLFPGCTAQIPQLSPDEPSLAGLAFVDNAFVEIHVQIDAANLATVYVVTTAGNCDVLASQPVS